MTSNFEIIREVVAEILDVPAEAVKYNSVREDFPNWDSMQHLNIVMEVEGRLNCKIPFDRVLEIKSVSELCQIVSGAD